MPIMKDLYILDIEIKNECKIEGAEAYTIDEGGNEVSIFTEEGKELLKRNGGVVLIIGKLTGSLRPFIQE